MRWHFSKKKLPEQETAEAEAEAPVVAVESPPAEAEARENGVAKARENGAIEDLESHVIEALKSVYDPEIPVNIYDLGLIYLIQVNPDNSVYIRMTLTAPNCPVAGILPQQAEDAVKNVPGVSDARVELVFDPPFHRDMMSDAAKLELGLL